jgi:hypothetical protein
VLGRITRSNLNPNARSFRFGGGFEMVVCGHAGNSSSRSSGRISRPTE